MAGTNEHVEATARRLRLRSALGAAISLVAGLTTLFAGFASTKLSHFPELLFAVVVSVIAAVVATVLQLSKARFERKAIASLVGSRSSVTVDPQATQAIAVLEPDAQVKALELLQRLSTNPTGVINTAQRLASAPEVFKTRLTDHYAILWRRTSGEPAEITVLNLVGTPDRKSTLLSDYVIPA